jgi:hypothetical protein
MFCQLCGKEKKLIDAHIIPRQLYKPLEQSENIPPADEVLRVYSTTTYSKKRPIGTYDSKILCGDCDNEILGVLDNYAQTLLLKPFTETNYLSKDGKKLFYKLEDIDYPKFKLFFMSVLWRASITNQDFFHQVNLGSWESVLKDMILNADPGTENDFSVILSKYEGASATIMPNPQRIRTEGINYYKFRMGSYSVLIKVDQRPFPGKLKPVVLRPNQPLLIQIKDYEDSKEFNTILENIDKFIK